MINRLNIWAPSNKLIWMIHILSISCGIALRWTLQDLTDDKSALVQVLAWCHQAPSHYLSQRWPRYMSPYGITRPQWVNTLPENNRVVVTTEFPIRLLKPRQVNPNVSHFLYQALWNDCRMQCCITSKWYMERSWELIEEPISAALGCGWGSLAGMGSSSSSHIELVRIFTLQTSYIPLWNNWGYAGLTEWGLVKPHNVNNLSQHWFRQLFVTGSASNLNLNQYRLRTNATPTNIIYWFFFQNSDVFIQENAF